jgi:hypothetical protein
MVILFVTSIKYLNSNLIVATQLEKAQLAATERSLADWHSFSWKEFKIKNPPAPRQLHTMVTHNDSLV